jgi:hypothetical protein
MADIPEEISGSTTTRGTASTSTRARAGRETPTATCRGSPWVDLRENRIDVILDAKLGDWNHKLRYWNGTDFTGTTDLEFRRTGATLEWKG